MGEVWSWTHLETTDAVRLQLIFAVREGFRSGPFLDIFGSLQHLNSSRVRERDEALLRSVMVGGFGVVSCWVGLEVSLLIVGFVVLRIVMVSFFLGNVPFLLLLRSVKILSFMIS